MPSSSVEHGSGSGVGGGGGEDGFCVVVGAVVVDGVGFGFDVVLLGVGLSVVVVDVVELGADEVDDAVGALMASAAVVGSPPAPVSPSVIDTVAPSNAAAARPSPTGSRHERRDRSVVGACGVGVSPGSGLRDFRARGFAARCLPAMGTYLGIARGGGLLGVGLSG
ncbi:hypothetical protein GCM10009676_31550 [Prauserella halophila]|uniref:Uncharacterized protein n=1 Tax=Prauserella halophila TaxID=185641 RepID=A0ABN1WE21_9PSEU